MFLPKVLSLFTVVENFILAEMVHAWFSPYPHPTDSSGSERCGDLMEATQLPGQSTSHGSVSLLTHWRLWCGSRCQEAAAGALRFRKDIMSDYPFLKKHLRKRNHPTIGHLTLTVTKDDVMLCQNNVSWDLAYALYTFLKSNWAWCHVHVIPELGWRKHPRGLLVNQIIPSGKFQATERPYL